MSKCVQVPYIDIDRRYRGQWPAGIGGENVAVAVAGSSLEQEED